MADRISTALERVTRSPWVTLVIYALLVPAAALLATRIPSEGGIDRLIVPGDPDYQATRAFQRIFPERQTLLLVLESEDPWSPASIARLEAAERALRGLPHASAYSVLDALRRARPAAGLPELERLAQGTDFFRRQGLAGDRFLTLLVSLDVAGAGERDEALQAIDARLAGAEVGPVRRIGGPYVTAWLEQQSAAASRRSFPIFGVLLVVVVLFLYRSWRTLLAIVLALGAAVALAVGAGRLLGFTFTIVSVLMPLTVMVTTLASLVYVHSRFTDQPAGVPLRAHQLAALRNKFLPVTASTLAAALGFGALVVSPIRPIREMGLWTGLGLLLSWAVVFTLFPALQRLLRTPTGPPGRARAGAPAPAPGGYERLAAAVPGFTFRHRRPLAAGALALAAAGAVALFGVPGLLGGMSVSVDTLGYLDPSTALYRDLRWFREHVTDLNLARVWIHLPRPDAAAPEVLRAVDRLQSALEALPGVTGVAGPTTPLRMRSYLAGQGEALPGDAAGFARAAGDVEQLLLTQPDLRTFVSLETLADLQLTVLFGDGSAEGYAALVRRVEGAWRGLDRAPALEGAELRVVGEALLSAKVGASLVPTLAQSFVLTVALVFTVFLLVFRDGVERLLAMIPSLFALLVAFLGLRLLGGALNVATIIIATTVVGTTENDQIHFFHHMHERGEAGLEERLRHALRVSGKAIVFATLINAVGFLGLAVSTFPPLRQFGLLTAAAFLLALLADFTALPAALWLFRRVRSGPPPASRSR